MDCDRRCVNFTGHFPVRKNLESLGAVDGTAYFASDSHLRGANDGFDIRLFCNVNTVSGREGPLNPTVNMQGSD